ncbi:hypothetical protein RZR22_22930, partial [Escherichia coli]|nr:hypothetical protein [Escherichia coli]
DRNRSHWSTSKTPSYTKSVSWQHHPFLLQKIMDQKLEGYDMPTADPVNYLNAGGSFGGTYAQ